jgi:diguanylate cyclase (GGDEF)-like protein/PAS domain S-box-containing protein
MKSFQDWSIRAKLKGLFLVIAAVTAVTIALPMAFFDFIAVRRSMIGDLATLADALGRNSTAALTFRDAKISQDTLEALSAESGITSACVYTKEGEVLAKYVRQGNLTEFVPPVIQHSVTRFERGHLLLFRDVVLDGEQVGTIFVESDLQRLHSRLRDYAVALVVTLLISLCLALLLASRLQRPITAPLAQLMDTAVVVSIKDDYSVRADLHSGDEFGLLGSTFNDMLEQIEKRDKQLRHHRERLEQEVAFRTSELLTANAQLSRAEEKYRTIFEDAVVGIFQMTPEGKPNSVNRALAQMHGYHSPEHFLAEVSDVSAQLFVEPGTMQQLKDTLEKNDGIVRGAEIEVYRRDGSRKWAMTNMRVVRDAQGSAVLYEGTVEDITDRKAAEERVEFLAYYDALTELPNRTLLRDRLVTALAGARRRGEMVGLLFLDLDQFKFINDSLGHSFGDLLLQRVAGRLKGLAREQDTVARIGGDEFLIVLTGVREPSDMAVAAERLMNAMSKEFLVQGRSFSITCSIGMSVFPEHGADAETLIKNADAAMYCAKGSGRNAFRFFTEEMNAEVIERMTMENGMRQALENNELFLVYQPQMDVVTGQIVGLEALLRWQHPELGLVGPDRFIRVAENSGLIVPIGEWVLKTACSSAKRWQTDHHFALPVAVNVSAIQFRKEGFANVVRQVLRDTGLEARFLELEMTESLLLSDARVTLQVLQELKHAGLRMSIDDFGTGYSSLSYLRHFPVDKLKIDRSFIRTATLNSDDAVITTAIINLARSLNLKVIAEGVETEAQFSFLRERQCDEIQGYYFSKPITEAEVVQLMQKYKDSSLKTLAARKS